MKTRTNYLDDYAARRLRINRLVTEAADRGDFNTITRLNRLLDDWIRNQEHGVPLPATVNPEPVAIDPEPEPAPSDREAEIRAKVQRIRAHYPDRGVYHQARNHSRPWRAVIQHDNRTMELGRYATKEEAREAYLAAYEHKLRHGKLP